MDKLSVQSVSGYSIASIPDGLCIKTCSTNAHVPPRSHPATDTTTPSHQAAAEQALLRKQRLDAYMDEPLESGNRLVALPDRNAPTEPRGLPQCPPLAKQAQDLLGIGSWTD